MHNINMKKHENATHYNAVQYILLYSEYRTLIILTTQLNLTQLRSHCKKNINHI